MGIYLTDCISCGKTFQWWSGCLVQMCPECIEKAGGLENIKVEIVRIDKKPNL